MSTQPAKTKPGTEGPAVAPAAAAAKPGSTRKTRSHTISLVAMAFALVGVVAALALMRQRTSDAALDVIAVDRDAAAQPAAAARASEPTDATAAAERAAAPQPAVELPKNRPTKTAKRAAALRPAPAAAAQAPESHGAEETTAKPADVEKTTVASVPPQATETAALSTITGCLEVSTDEDQFRLTDTEGIEAPRARSWRTAFLKKRSASVDLVGSFDTAAMIRQVGKRVAATGVLTSRELKVNSVRVVGSSCE